MNDPDCVQLERVVKTEMRVEASERRIEEILIRIDRFTAELGESNRLLTRVGGMVAGAAILVSIIWATVLGLWRILSDLHL